MVDPNDVDSLKSARSLILESVKTGEKVAESPSALGASFTTAWASIPTGLPRALLTPVLCTTSFVSSTTLLKSLLYDSPVEI